MTDSPLRAIIVSDGKRGHENQSRVIARMLGISEPLRMLLRPQFKEGGWTELMLRLRLRLRGPQSLSRAAAGDLVRAMLKPEQPEAFRELVDEIAAARVAGGVGADLVSARDLGTVDGPNMFGPYADGPRQARPLQEQHLSQSAAATSQLQLFTISTGTPPATLNLVLARLLEARPLVSMTPSLLPLRFFSAALLPDHDLPQGFSMAANTLVSPLALSYHDRPAAQLLASTLAAEFGLAREGRYVGLALGGPSKNSDWQEGYMRTWLVAVLAHCKATGSKLLVTNSRRTPAWATKWLAERAEKKEIAAFIDANKDLRNPLPAFYELCWQVQVTADSISMLSEAVQAGHRPVVHWTSASGPRGKLKRFIDNLASGGDIFPSASVLPTDSLRREDRINANYNKLQAQLLTMLGLD